MVTNSQGFNYKQDYSRYRYHFGRIYQFYQKPVAKVSTALLLTIFTTIFFAVFAIRPTLVTIAELLRKIEDQRQTLAEMKKKAGALNAAQQEYDAKADVRARLDQAIPEEDGVSLLIKNIEGAAAQNQVAVASLQVQEYIYGPPGPSNSNEAQELEVSSSYKSGYVNLKPLVRELFYLPRLLAIDSVNLVTKDENRNQTTVGELTLTVGSRVFYLPRSINQSNPTGL
jgi:Tfp pilus assembly protein PilO